jgi:DNA repair protein RadC
MKDIQEKLLFLGESVLSDYELLALSLGDTKVSECLMNAYQSLSAIHTAPRYELHKIKGMGTSKIARLKATTEINKRIHMERIKINRSQKLQHSQDVFNILQPIFIHEEREIFLLLPLDAKNRLISAPITISAGSLICTVVHPREVMLPLILLKAVSGILAHNHPSSHDPEPSEEDLLLSNRLKAAGEIIGIKFIDHLIVGGDKYISLTDQGLW